MATDNPAAKQRRTAKDERDLRFLKKRLNSYGSAKDALSNNFFSYLLTEEAV